MSCPHAKGCPLFPLFRLRASLSIWQTHFCEGDFASCERYRLSQAGRRVPPNLLPNGKTLELPTRPASP
jgi:hypothetical protein